MEITAINRLGPEGEVIVLRLGGINVELTPDQAREARIVLDIAWRTPLKEA